LTADAVVVSARADGLIDLEFSPSPKCGACAGTCLWKRLQAARLDRLRVSGRLEPGTPVSVAMPGRQVLLASILLYGAPLFAILVGAVFGAIVSENDSGTLLGAVVALGIVIVGFGALRRRLEQAALASLIVKPKS
jgi:positive regulator of sigma E activity